MGKYPVQNIRNISLLGHGGDGKTSLAESILFVTKNTDRLGHVADGNTVSDFDSEEIKRQISISMTALPVEFGQYKLNVMDTPGYFDFVGEVFQSLRVSSSGLIVLTAKSGIGVGTEKAWKYVTQRDLPRMFYVSKLDEENADFFKTLSSLRDTFGISVCPVVIPIVEGGKPTGVIDIMTRKAFSFDKGKSEEIDIPSFMEERVDELYNMLSESVAETSEQLMEKFFADEPFTKEEMIAGVRAGVADKSLAPVFCGSALFGLGTMELLYGIANYLPSPLDVDPEKGTDENGKDVEVKYDPDGPVCAVVFKTLIDQYGKFSFFKVVSGKVTKDLTLVNATTGLTEKIGHIYSVRGKKNTEIGEVCCGDIGAVSKLTHTRTGDTLCDARRVVALGGIDFPEPCYARAITPKDQGGEDKIASGLTRLNEEDLSFTVENNAETHQMTIAGTGDIQLDVLCSKLKNKFGVDTDLSEVRVPYREKIRKKVKVEGKHKKQSGGHGQYGHVWVEFEPGDTEDMFFEQKIFGGSVPKNFHPAVEKGLRDSIPHGVLAGYPVVFLKATLVDGSYHDVDSSEMAFKLAASLAYKAGLPKADPVLLEPVGLLKVNVPDHYTGDIIGDLNKRRGRVMGMNPCADGQEIEAEVPMAEMSSYAIDLRSMTHGRGTFSLKFERYEEAPPNVQQKVIEEAKHLQEEE